jgi:hypothetical protein
VSEVGLFVTLKLGKADFACAQSQVAPYATSANDAIKTSAEGTTVTFARLAQLNDRAVAEYKAILDSASEGKPLKQGSVAERQAELAVAYDEAWKLLIPSVIAGTYAIVEKNPSTGLMSGLALTRQSSPDMSPPAPPF